MHSPVRHLGHERVSIASGLVDEPDPRFQCLLAKSRIRHVDSDEEQTLQCELAVGEFCSQSELDSSAIKALGGNFRNAQGRVSLPQM